MIGKIAPYSLLSAIKLISKVNSKILYFLMVTHSINDGTLYSNDDVDYLINMMKNNERSLERTTTIS